MRDIDALREHFETWNTCPSCGAQWKDETPTPSILHRTVVCATCKPAPLVIVRLPVQSSNIRSIGYLLSAQILDVEFTTGRRVYRYFQVPALVVGRLIAAPSIGEAFALLIKAGGFRYVVLPPEVVPAVSSTEPCDLECGDRFFKGQPCCRHGRTVNQSIASLTEGRAV